MEVCEILCDYLYDLRINNSGKSKAFYKSKRELVNQKEIFECRKKIVWFANFEFVMKSSHCFRILFLLCVHFN